MLVFEINKEDKDGCEQVVFNNKTFYTIYKEAIINKKDNYGNMYLCFEKAIGVIKSQRKKYKNEKSNSSASSKKNN